MIGQGSPTTLSESAAARPRTRSRWKWRLLLVAMIALAAPQAGWAQTMRVRISWGGGQPRTWQGRATVTNGFLANPNPLGIEADEPGSIWTEKGQLFLQQRSPRDFDGVDLEIHLNNDSVIANEKLQLTLTATDGLASRELPEIPLSDLLGTGFSTTLDDQGNRLLIRRGAEDLLRVRLHEYHHRMVFAPGDVLAFEVQPHLLPVEPGSRVDIAVSLNRGRTSERLWGPEEYSVEADRAAPIPLQIALPSEEGVYDVVITATQKTFRPRASISPFQRKVVQRKIQLIVIDDQRPQPQDPAIQEVVDEIDPANPRWWEKLPQLPGLDRLRKAPLGNGRSDTWKHESLGNLTRLHPREDGDDVAWEAYTLPVKRPNLPHIIEIEYPSDMPQSLGISLVEPNRDGGGVFPFGLDSGVQVSDQIVGPLGPPRMLTHRIVFWPRTSSPLILLTNRRDNAMAVYGKIRIFAGRNHLREAFPSVPIEERRGRRLMAGYMDRPLFPENFSASEAPDASSQRDVDDWITFYEGGSRLVEYLHYAGFGGLMMGVAADGSAIYPSQLLQPTPGYDTGALLDTGQDPVRKDVLEMLLRMFDREGLQLIPMLEFGAPLPELEAILRRGGIEAEGIRWIGHNGTAWTDQHAARRGMAPRYNVLDPRVQAAMLRVVEELVQRYGHHPSFSGLSLHLSAHGYAQLPGPDWGMDDVTIARFEQTIGQRLPSLGPDRFRERNQLLAARYGQEWLAWRAKELGLFHDAVRATLTNVRPDTKLYLAGATMLAGAELQYALKPDPSRESEMSLADALLQVGIDVKHYQQDPSMILLQPNTVEPRWSLPKQAVSLEIEQMLAMDDSFAQMPTPGSLFFHEPRELYLKSFNDKSPFQPILSFVMAAEMTPSGHQNRRRFVHSLATLDSQVMFDGGWSLPLGQEESIRDLISVYRRLPAVPFERLAGPYGSSETQPVTIAHASDATHTYVYLVNDAPFPTSVTLQLSLPPGSQLEELSGLRTINPLRPSAEGSSWTVHLEPYDLVGFRAKSPSVALAVTDIDWASQVDRALETKIADLKEHNGALFKQPTLDVVANPGFESPATDADPIPGWWASAPPNTSVTLDSSQSHGGANSILLSSRNDDPTKPAELVSQQFDPPVSGRLTMEFRIRVDDAGRPPPLRICLQGKLDNGEVRPYAVTMLSGDSTRPGEWDSFTVKTNDLPLEGLVAMRVRFDLMGPGRVWIDDVKLSSLQFTRDEGMNLVIMVQTISEMQDRKQVADCIRLLQGYWPRFLMTNVPLQHVSVADTLPTPQKPAEEQEKPTSAWDRMRQRVPEKIRFF